MSIKVLADNGYKMIFHPYQEGVTIHDEDNATITITKDALLQEWRDTQDLWHFPLINDITNLATHTIDLDRPASSVAINSVYELPTAEHMVRYLHATLGFPIKATLLTPPHKGNLLMFPGLMVKNITKFFPESDEMQKGHMQQQKQGIRSTKIPDKDALLSFSPTPGMQNKDVYFDATKKVMYTNQTDCFPITSSKD